MNFAFTLKFSCFNMPINCIFIVIWAIFIASISCQPPWYLDASTISLDNEASNAAYDPQSGWLIIFSDSASTIYGFNVTTDSSFGQKSPITWALDSQYPSGQYGLKVIGRDVIYCGKGLLGSKCEKIDITASPFNPQVLRQRYETKYAPSIFVKNNQALIFSTSSVFGYYDFATQSSVSNAVLESRPRVDDYMAGPTFEYKGSAFVMWLRSPSSSMDRERSNLLKIGRYCFEGSTPNVNFYFEKPFSSPVVGSQNLSVTNFGDNFALASWQSPNSLSICYLTKQMIADEMQNAIDDCSQGISAELPGFTDIINAAVNCKNKIVKTRVSRGCLAATGFFASSTSRECVSAETVDLHQSLSHFVASTSLVLSASKTILVYADANGRYAKVLVTKSSEGTFTSTLMGNENLADSVGPLEAGEQVSHVFTQQSYAQLVFVTSQRVVRIPASNCTQFTTCGACQASGDPLCAWCPSTGVCSLTKGASCPDVIRADGGVCPSLRVDDIDLDKNHEEISVEVRQWPFNAEQPQKYFCEFDGNNRLQQGRFIKSRKTVLCPVPRVDLSRSPSKTISLRFLVAFAREDFRKIEIARLDSLTVYKCSSLTNCSTCANAVEGKCSWCFSQGKCFSQANGHCQKWAVVTKNNCPTLDGIYDPESMKVEPYLEYPFGESDMPTSLRLRIKSGFGIFQEADSFHCTFQKPSGQNFGGPFPATHQDGYVLCNIDGFQVPDDLNLLPADKRELILRAVVVADNQVIDFAPATTENQDEGDMSIRFYSCSPAPSASISFNTCGHCRALKDKWKCAWCDSKCLPMGKCSTLVSREDVCRAQIKNFYPKFGPLEGGTMLTIDTVDLDTEISDLRVRVAGLHCPVDQTETRLPDKVVCITSSALGNNNFRSGSVQLYNRTELIATTGPEPEYTYLTLMSDKRYKVAPRYGPRRGGTHISINGYNLGIGTTRSVWLGDKRCGDISVVSDNELQCTSGFSLDVGEVPVHVVIDSFNSSIFLQNMGSRDRIVNFQYRRNPQPRVTSAISDLENANIMLALRGGSPVKVVGRHMDASADPKFVIRLRNGKLLTSPCFIMNHDHLWCRSPSFPETADSTKVVDYGVVFSESSEFWSSNQASWPHLEVAKDPEFVKATIDTATSILTLSGFRLNQSYLMDDYNITVADRACLVKTLSSKVIVCELVIPQLPPNSSQNIIPMENVAHSIVSIVLGNIQRPIEIQSLASVDAAGDVDDVFRLLLSNSLPIVIPAGVGIVLVLVVIILVACICSKTKRDNMRKYEKTKSGLVTQQQQQLTKFQRRIFANQTQVAPQEVRWNADIPFHKYQDYCNNFFFPVIDDFRSIQTPPDVANIGVSELSRFHQLLLNENFLVAFINAHENPHNFKHADITRVAALLSVVLQPHMTYHTKIIRRLLDELIMKTAQRNPSELKQLLRRAEHVVERLLANWLAMLLYGHVLSGPGKALFRLTRACHLKVTSGKVDQATGRSLYALSERSLLQDPSEPLEINLNIFDNVTARIQSEEGRRTVTVLDCDTVGQVKAKILDAIYEGVPFSDRLTPTDCDIQYVQSDGKRVDLPDDSQRFGNGTLSNGKTLKPTLIKSFNLENNAKVIIFRKPAGTYGTNTTSLKSVVSQQSSNGVGASTGTGDSHSLLNGSPLLPTNQRALVPNVNSSANNSGIFYGIDSSLAGEEPKTPGASRRAGLLNNNRRRMGSERGDKRNSRASTMSSAVACSESAAPPSEYFLSLLLITKKSLQEHIDNLFTSLFQLPAPTAATDPGFPLAIRYLFDTFDELGKKHKITDPEVLYCWKTNAVPLRFWVNLIQNPDYLLDVEVVEPVKHCLSVVTQALMDSCARDPLPLSHRSASNKQLFSEDVLRYRGYVQKYYSDIQHVDFDEHLEIVMNNYLSKQSLVNERAFDAQGSLRRLAEAALRYSTDIDRQLRTGQGMLVPASDGQQLADEFAGILRDLQTAGIGSAKTTLASNVTPGSGSNTGTGLSFTATPVGVATPQQTGNGAARSGGRSGSQQKHQNQYIVMQPTHLV